MSCPSATQYPAAAAFSATHIKAHRLKLLLMRKFSRRRSCGEHAELRHVGRLHLHRVRACLASGRTAWTATSRVSLQRDTAPPTFDQRRLVPRAHGYALYNFSAERASSIGSCVSVWMLSPKTNQERKQSKRRGRRLHRKWRSTASITWLSGTKMSVAWFRIRMSVGISRTN